MAAHAAVERVLRDETRGVSVGRPVRRQLCGDEVHQAVPERLQGPQQVPHGGGGHRRSAKRAVPEIDQDAACSREARLKLRAQAVLVKAVGATLQRDYRIRKII